MVRGPGFDRGRMLRRRALARQGTELRFRSVLRGRICAGSREPQMATNRGGGGSGVWEMVTGEASRSQIMPERFVGAFQVGPGGGVSTAPALTHKVLRPWQ